MKFINFTFQELPAAYDPDLNENLEQNEMSDTLTVYKWPESNQEFAASMSLKDDLLYAFFAGNADGAGGPGTINMAAACV